MSDGRRRDPRAEPDEGIAPLVEKPFDSSSRAPQGDDASTSRVRAAYVPPTADAPGSREPVRPKAPSLPDLIDFERPSSVAGPTAPSHDAVTAPPPGQPAPAPKIGTETPEPLFEAAAPRDPSPGASPPLSSASLDALTVSVTRMVDEGRWNDIVATLAPHHSPSLAPHLALVYAIARAEVSDGAGSVDDALVAMARAHGLDRTSPITILLAKRLLRRSPRTWTARPAPRGPVTILIVALTLVLGGGGGYWLSTTKVQIPLPSFLLSK